MNVRIANFLVAHRRPALAATILTAVLAASAAARLQFDFTPQALFAGEKDLVSFNDRVKETFGHSENVVLVVQSAVGKQDLLDPLALTWNRDLCGRLRRIENVVEVDGLATLHMPRPRWLSGTMMNVPVLDDGPIDEQTSDLVRRRVEGQPLIDGVLMSKDRRTGAIALHLDPAHKDIAHVSRVLADIRQAVEEIAAPSGYDVFLGGLPAMRAEIVASLKRDQLTIIPACVIVFAAVEWLIFRCWAGVIVPAIAIGVGLAWTLAALVLLDQPLTIISNVLPILLMIVGVSTCVHFLNAYAEQAELRPGDRIGAARETVRHMTLACFLTSLTTAMGFLSLFGARSELLRGLGWQAAMGIGLFYVASVLVCATTLPLFAPPRSHDRRGGQSPLARAAWRLGAPAAHHPGATLAMAIALVATAAMLGSRVPVDSFLIETYDQDHPEVVHMRAIENELAGFAPMEVILRGDAPQWYWSPDNWRRIKDFGQRSANDLNVLLVRSPVDALQQADKLIPGGTRLVDIADSDDRTLNDRLDRLHSFLRRNGGDDVLHSLVADDGVTVRVALRVRDSGTLGALELGGRLHQWLDELFPPELHVEHRITGEAYVAAVAINRFIHDLLYSLLGVSALIFVVIGLLMRSLRLGLVSILPNVAPLAITLGYMGVKGYPLNMGNVIVFAISLGVAVDDTIHFLARFREEERRQEDGDVEAALQRTCWGTGRAVLLTTILIVCGLSLLLFSAFVPTRRFAELTAVTMISALLGDLLLLPALLKLAWRRPQRTQPS